MRKEMEAQEIMTCNRMREWISLECDGHLEPERVPRLLAHLEACEECRTYRSDLQLGQRLLRATQAEPAEGFAWRLQLRLNNALKDAAREAAAPWPVPSYSWRRWLGPFAVASSVGLAAVLAVALFTMPATGVRGPIATGEQVAVDGLARVPLAGQGATEFFDRSRRPLTPAASTSRVFGAYGNPYQQTVSLERGGGLSANGWNGLPSGDLVRLQRLQQENDILRHRATQAELRSQRLQARLDSLSFRPLDNQQ